MLTKTVVWSGWVTDVSGEFRVVLMEDDGGVPKRFRTVVERAEYNYMDEKIWVPLRHADPVRIEVLLLASIDLASSDPVTDDATDEKEIH